MLIRWMPLLQWWRSAGAWTRLKVYRIMKMWRYTSWLTRLSSNTSVMMWRKTLISPPRLVPRDFSSALQDLEVTLVERLERVELPSSSSELRELPQSIIRCHLSLI